MEDYVIPETNQGGDEGDSDLFRLRVVPSRNYRLELSFPGTTDGRPANVGIQLFSVYQELFDLGLGDAEDTTFRIWQSSIPLDGGVSFEFRARQVIEVRGHVIPNRLHAAFYLGEYHFEPGDLYTMVLTDITDSGDDYLGAEETTGAVAVGGRVTGNLEVDNDMDWFRVPLEASKTYRIRMRGSESGGGTLDDPFTSIGDGYSTSPVLFGFGTGQTLHNDDRSETEKDSELVVATYAQGDAYIKAGTPGTGTGTYTIEVEDVTPQNQRANTPATGWPAVSGTVRVGKTLTATTEGIEDEDGMTGAVFAYQWVRVDPNTSAKTDIAGATGSTYTVTAADSGKGIKVRVTFTDDGGNQESLTSNVHLSSPPLLGLFGVGAEGPADTETAETGTPLTATIHDAPEYHNGSTKFTFELRFSEEPKEDFSYETLRDHAFTVTGGSVEGARRLEDGKNIRWEVTVEPTSSGDVTISLPLMEDCEADAAICTDDGRMLSEGLELTVIGPDSQQRAENIPATGAPAVSGTVRVGETLTATTEGIEDEDGLTGAVFAYQWVRRDLKTNTDTDIPGVMGSTYTVTGEDAGKAIKVRVTFTDDAGNEESLTSAATAAVSPAVQQQQAANTKATGKPVISGTARVGETLTADTSTVADEDGLDNVSYTYQWIQNDGSTDTDIAGGTSSTYTLVSADEGKAISVKVSFTDDTGNQESLTSAATDPVEARPNRPATGQPTISGTDRVGETLTADTSTIADEDGLTNVSYSYQWMADDTDIDGGTGATYTLADSDEGKTIQVGVTFTDDAGNQESLTSAATAAVVKPPLTATIHDEPSSHNGQDTFTFELRFSEEPKTGFSYETLRDHAFTVTRGTVEGRKVDEVRRLVSGSNIRWEITVSPESNGDITVVLPITTDCTADGAICTDDGRMLSRELELTVSGPDSQQQAANTPATGEPSINGTARVGETLRADTSGIADEDGLDNVSFSYQWMADDADIEGATSSTYTPADADEGKAIKVKVSFTDDAGNPETLTSAATEAAAAPRPPLTATIHDAPKSHDGQEDFTFELRFSEEPEEDFSYETLKDHAFTVTGGTVKGARRLVSGSNIRWEITVSPDSNSDVTVKLPATEDCGAQGAICTDDGRMLSEGLEFTVSRPGS